MKQLKQKSSIILILLIMGILAVVNLTYSQSTIIFSDDFQDGNDDGWDRLTDSYWSVHCVYGGACYYSLNETEYWRDEYSLIKNKEFDDFELTVRISTPEANTGNRCIAILFGYQKSNSYYYMKFSGLSNENKLYRTINGSATVLKSYPYSTLNSSGHWYNVKIVRKNPNIKVYIDNNKIIECNDGTFNVGKIALGAWGYSAMFDDVKIWGLEEQTVNVIINQIDATNFPVIKCYVTVTDQNFQPITNLSSSHFLVREDGVTESPITVTARGGSQNVNVAFAMDYSGSMSSTAISDMEAAVTTFVNLMNTNDRGAVFKFAQPVIKYSGFTSNKSTLYNAINSNFTGNTGSTQLYGAIYDCISEAIGINGRKAVIALTDGGDNYPTRSISETINHARNNSTPVFTIGLGSGVDTNVLTQIANSTGGLYYYAPNSSDLRNIYNLISQAIANQYEVTYTTHNQNSCVNPNRNVYIQVNYNSLQGNDYSSYQTPPCCSITVTDPNGGESWDEKSTQTIRWSSTGTSGNVRIRYSFNSGSNWTILTNSTPDDGSWNWALPNVSSDQTHCRVRVEDSDNSACYDVSNSDFTIRCSCDITVDDPNGGETWEEGSTHAIRWQSVNTSGNVRIRYSTNSGSNWTILIDSTPDDGSWSWTLHDVSSDQTHCRVRVEDAANSACYDISNNDFTIKDNPLFNITGKVKYYEGDTPVPNVELSLVPNNITTLTDADGNYGFNDLEGGIDYTVTPSKDAGTDQSSLTITSQDAYQTSQLTFGIITPNQYQTIVADVDGDEQILMWDASLILSHTVGQQLPDSIAMGDWRFDPEKRNYPSLNSNQTDQDYIAIVMGDVNGSWSATNLLSQASSNIIDNIKITQIDSNAISLPIRLNEQLDLTSIDLQLSYNPAEFKYNGLKRNISSDVFKIVENNTSGLLKIGGFAIKKQKMEIYSTLFVIVFKRENSFNEQSEIQINRLLVNDTPQGKKTISVVNDLTVSGLFNKFQLYQNYPNPFNPETTIRYTLGWNVPKLTIINIYDVTGKLIKRLSNIHQKTGEFEVRWDGLNEDRVEVPSGVYICSIRSGDKIKNIKMLKIK